MNPTSWTVRPGGILDVNPVTRLLRACARPVDIDGDGIVDVPTDPAAADAAARMLLLHVVIERGRLEVAEHEGEIVGAAVWLPGDTGPLPDGVEELLRRELRVPDVAQAIGPGEHVRPHLEATMAGVLTSIAQEEPALVLYAVAISPAIAREQVVALARDLVAPVLAEGRSVLAVALDAGRAGLLRAAGFTELGRVPLGAGGEVWLGSQDPAASPALSA